MTDAILKGVSAILFVAVVFLAGMRWVDVRTINDLSARNEELNGSLQAIDLKAKADEQKFKEVSNAIKVKDDKYRAAISYYERMLSEAANRTRTGEAPKDTAGVDASPGGPTLSGCPVEVEREFFEDARVRAGMAEFFRTNSFQIAD